MRPSWDGMGYCGSGCGGCDRVCGGEAGCCSQRMRRRAKQCRLGRGARARRGGAQLTCAVCCRPPSAPARPGRDSAAGQQRRAAWRCISCATAALRAQAPCAWARRRARAPARAPRPRPLRPTSGSTSSALHTAAACFALASSTLPSLRGPGIRGLRHPKRQLRLCSRAMPEAGIPARRCAPPRPSAPVPGLRPHAPAHRHRHP